MTLHLFRLKQSDNEFVNNVVSHSSLEHRLDETYPLYAFTEKKKTAAKFIAERDMSKFIYVTAKVNKNDHTEWMHHHRGMWLDYYKMTTYKNKYTPRQQECYAKILMTENEYTYVDQALEISAPNILAQYTTFLDIDIFDPELKRDLITVGYEALWGMYQEINDTECVDNFDAIEILQNYGWDSGITFDQYGLFILIYENLLSEDFYNNVEFITKED